MAQIMFVLRFYCPVKVMSSRLVNLLALSKLTSEQLTVQVREVNLEFGLWNSRVARVRLGLV